MEIICYTDGAVKGNGGQGVMGMAAVLIHMYQGAEKHTKAKSWRVEAGHVTNNLAELLAVRYALDLVKPECKPRSSIRIITDSQLVVRWISGEYRCNSHPDLVNEIKTELAKFQSARVDHCKGHAGNPLNERCNMLAQLEAGTWRGSRP
jgi:ribonuclease HI